jgi:hypothetical protein
MLALRKYMFSVIYLKHSMEQARIVPNRPIQPENLNYLN